MQSYAVGLPQKSGIWRTQPGRSAPPQQPCTHKCNVEENTLIENRKSVITFICKVVNVAPKQERKSDRIKTVVEAAEGFLGIMNIYMECCGQVMMEALRMLFGIIMLFQIWILIANGQSFKKVDSRITVYSIQETWLRPHLVPLLKHING